MTADTELAPYRCSEHVEQVVQDTIAWIERLLRRYPRSKFVFLTLISCDKQFQDVATAYNLRMRAYVRKTDRVDLLDREPSTLDESVACNKTHCHKEKCEAWHAYGVIVQGHVSEFIQKHLPDHSS